HERDGSSRRRETERASERRALRRRGAEDRSGPLDPREQLALDGLPARLRRLLGAEHPLHVLPCPVVVLCAAHRSSASTADGSAAGYPTAVPPTDTLV